MLTTASTCHPEETKLTICAQTKENTNYTLLLNHKYNRLHAGTRFVLVLDETILHVTVFTLFISLRYRIKAKTDCS